MKSDNDQKNLDLIADEKVEVYDQRREFLKKCGKFAAYSAPVMATLLLFDRKKAHAATPV